MFTEQNASVRANNCTRSCSKKTLARLESFTFFHQFPTGRAGKIGKIQLLMLACILHAFLRMKLLRGQRQIDGGKRLRYTYDSHVSRSYQNRVLSKYISYCYISLLISFASSTRRKTGLRRKWSDFPSCAHFLTPSMLSIAISHP